MNDALFYEFAFKCMRIGILPNEKHIDAFLNSVDRYDLRNEFIKRCFYHWDKVIELRNELQ